MRATRVLILALAVALVPAIPASASWVSENCYTNNHSATPKTRGEARAYAYVAVDEGYEWGGGCYNDNNRDDTPGQPDSGGEGPDCSGYTFRTWHLKSAYGATGWHWWSRWQNIHGPYSSAGFGNPPPDGPFFLLSSKARSVTDIIDAFTDPGHHIGMLWSNVPPSDNTDYIIEAAGDAAGTGIFSRSYRFDGDYLGVRRRNWEPPCNTPPCGAVVAVLG